MNSRSIVILATCIHLAGCAHSLVYDENRHKQAQAAEEAINVAHLARVVESLDKSYAEVSAKEEAAAIEGAEQRFDFELTSVSKASSLNVGLFSKLSDRLVHLGLANRTNSGLSKLLESRAKIMVLNDELTIQFAGFQGAVGYRFSSCTEADKVEKEFFDRWKDEQKAVAVSKFRAIAKSCTDLFDSEKAYRELFGPGEVTDQFGSVTSLEANIAAYEKERTKAKAVLAARKAEGAKVEAKTKPGEPVLQKVEERAKAIRAAIEDAKQINDLAGREIFAEEMVSRLEALLAAISGESADGSVKLSEDDLLTVRLVRELPTLKDEAEKLLKDSRKPRIVPYLVAVEYQKLELMKIEALQTVKRKEAMAARNALMAALDETEAIARTLIPSIEVAGDGSQSIAGLEATLKDKGDKGKDLRKFYAALASYGDSVHRARIDGEVWRIRQVAAQFELAQVNSRYSAAQWDALLDMGANVLADYHSAGIKTDDLNEFFKALGLVVIGVGAAQ